MIAFTRDFHVFASRVPTDISAVLLAGRNLAKTWDVRTFRRLLIDHWKSPLKASCEPLITEFGRTSAFACAFPNSTTGRNEALPAI
jgi:hypothetical protein